jgi:hypothetical protein
LGLVLRVNTPAKKKSKKKAKKKDPRVYHMQHGKFHNFESPIHSPEEKNASPNPPQLRQFFLCKKKTPPKKKSFFSSKITQN